mgnify:CR=1 FL=1
MFCSKCGTQLDDGVRFCPKCGAPVAGTDTTTTGVGPESGTTTGAKVRKRNPLAFVVAVLIVIAAACGGACLALNLVGAATGGGNPVDKILPPAVSGAERGEGNTKANLANGGYALCADGYDYFVSNRKGGICRAKVGSDEIEKVYGLESDGTQFVSHLNYDSGRIYFLETTYNTESASSEMCIKSVKVDGSDKQTVSKLDTKDGSLHITYNGLYIYDGTLYVTASGWDADSSYTKDTLRVMSLKEDGSDEKELLSETSNRGYMNSMVTKDRVYWAINPSSSDGSDTKGTICSQKLDGSDYKEIYTSSVGGMSIENIRDGRIFLSEISTNSSKRVWSSIKTDGSDRKEIVSFGDDGNDGYSYPIGFGEKNIFFVTTSEYGEVDKLWSLLIDGGEKTEVKSPDSSLYNPNVFDAGDHVIILGNGQDVGSAGIQVASMKADGSDAHNYVKSSD